MGDSDSRPRPAVLITGASGGIGRVVSHAFGRAGWYLGLHYWRNKTEAEAILQRVIAAGGTGDLYCADIRDADSVRAMVEAWGTHVSGPSVVVCAAGIGASSLLLRHREEVWADVIATNLNGTFHCLRAAAPFLIERGGGSIVVVGSKAGFQGGVGQAAYAASKAGLVGLVKTAAQEWGPQNVRVNLVLPGWQKTGLSEGAIPVSKGWKDHALRRPPSLEEVASTILHLAQLQDVSGQVWNCDSRCL